MRPYSPNACSIKVAVEANASAPKSPIQIADAQLQLTLALPEEHFAVEHSEHNTKLAESVAMRNESSQAPHSRPAVPKLRFDPKPFHLPPSPQKRPPSYRLVSNNIEGAIAHLRSVVTQATEQRDGAAGAHEVEFLRREVSRLATEIESRNEVIGELSDEARGLRTRLEEAHRREEAWACERERWEAERQEWSRRIDVLREIRRGLLGELKELRSTRLLASTADVVARMTQGEQHGAVAGPAELTGEHKAEEAAGCEGVDVVADIDNSSVTAQGLRVDSRCRSSQR